MVSVRSRTPIAAPWRALRVVAVVAAVTLGRPAVGGAQVPAPAVPRADTLPRRARTDSLRADSTRRDTARAAGPRRTRAAVAPRAGLVPPITPRRAFLSSLLVPGLGQARLDRPTAGAVFVAIELAALAMASKSAYDLRAAKAFRGDSVALAFPVDTATGLPLRGSPQGAAPFPNALVRARRLHVEDWLAVLAFNHLFAGAEAYVAANLWDLPAQVGALRTARGTGVAMSFAW